MNNKINKLLFPDKINNPDFDPSNTEAVTSIDQITQRLNKGWEWYIDNGGYKAEEADKILSKKLVHDY